MSSTQRDATAHPPALPAATAPQGTPAQPRPAKTVLTAAQRQWAYRQRSKHAITRAIGNEAHASRVALLALLGRCLAALDDEAASSMHSPARNSARRVITELVTRYDIEPQG